MIWWILALRLLHILGGVFWIGSLITVSLFVLPTAALSGPEGQRFLRRLALERGLTPAMLVSGSVTVLAGLSLMGIDSGGFRLDWFKSGMGVTLSIGGLAGIWALVVGIRSARLAARLGRLMASVEAAGGPPSAEQLAEAQAIGARLKRSSRTGTIHGAIAVLCMAMARYVAF